MCNYFSCCFSGSALAVKIIGLDRIAPLLAKLVHSGTEAGDSGDGAMTWYELLIHNCRTNLIILIVGIIPFIPVSALCMIYNGILVGSFTAFSALIASQSMLRSALFGIAPHGILEYALNCLVFAMGIYLFSTVTKLILKKDSDNLKTAALNCLRIFILIEIPGLLIAGIIEANITPLILSAVGM